MREKSAIIETREAIGEPRWSFDLQTLRRWFGLREEISPRVYRILSVSGFVLTAVAWVLASHLSFINPVFFPSPARVLASLKDSAVDGSLWADVRISVFRVTAGFLLSALLAVPLGMLVGAFKVIEGLLQPITEFVRYIPVPALIPLTMLFFGIGEPAKVMLIFVGTFFQLLLMVADEVRRVPYELVQVSYTLGTTKLEALREVLLKAALPGIFDALRLCNGWAWTYLVVAELVAANEGLGFRILKFSRFLQTPKIFGYLLVLGAIGLSLDFAFRRLNQWLFRWNTTSKR